MTRGPVAVGPEVVPPDRLGHAGLLIPAGPRHQWRVSMVERAFHDAAPPGRVLDAGAGTGTLALRLVASGRPVAALDLGNEALGRLAAARRRTTEFLQVVGGRIEALPWPDGHFAAAVAGEVLEHVDDHCAAAELWRVLQPGGALVVTVPAGPERFGALDRAVGHRRRYSRAGLRSVLRGAGFRVETMVGWGLPFGRIYDRLVQRPVLGAGPRAAQAVVLAGAFAPFSAVWRALFALDQTVAAGDRGSGLLAVGRKPEGPGRG